MNNYSVIFDVYEGSLQVDEAEFQRGGVVGLIVRLNDMSGGHHLDTGFAKQWAEAQAFNPAPYFVYNPWVNGQANFDWLAANMPANCPAVFIDTEVRYAGYSPDTYASQHASFISKCKERWKTIIYTGAGGLEIMSYWTTSVDYWWAAYPYSMYPTLRTNVTWAELKTKLDALTWPPYNSAVSPGPVKMWQCSGDRLIPPGSTRAMDISVFPGTAADYRAWLGYGTATQPVPIPVTPVLTLEQRVVRLEKLHNL